MSLPLFDIGSVVAIVGLAITVAKLYLEQRKAKKDIELSKQGLKILSRLVETYQRGQASQLQLEKQKLEFDKWKSAAKALGWILDRVEEE